MTETRKIAAILAADLVGFSRLTSIDEDRTLARLRLLRVELIDPTVASQNGRVFKRTGDGVLVEFRSVVEAVRCAIAIQTAMIERNVGLIAEDRLEFRIGVHLGDVVEESDGDLMGDGVNIAARLEGVARPGAVCLSEDAFRQVRARLDLAITELGEMKLKNIAEPIRAYLVHVGAQAAPTKPAAVPAAPDKPTIAVLAFQNMSGDPEQEYFADGIAEDVLTDLSRIGGLTVIARNSSFAYKGKAVDIRAIGRELGVRSVLEGSIRRAGARVRITAQLIDAQTGGHLWAERFDRELDDIFAVQDEVTRRIVDALKIKLSPREAASLDAARTTTSPKAHDLFLIGRALWWEQRRDLETFERATDLFRRAIAEDPDYGEAYAGLSMWENQNWLSHWTPDWRGALDRAHGCVETALRKSPNVAYVRRAASSHYFWLKDLDRAAAEADVALELSPNYAEAHNSRGIVYIYSGEPLAAVPYIQEAMRLDPVTRQAYLHFLGAAYLVAGRYEDAAATFRERIRLAPKTDLSRAFLAVALGHLGEAEEAQRIWGELTAINPKYSFVDHLDRLPFRNRADVESLAEGLRKAGIAA